MLTDKNALAPADEPDAAVADSDQDEAAPERPVTPAARPVARRLVTVCFWITIVLCLVLMTSKTVPRFEVRTLWDDSYMFQRYAHNVITDHRIAWNPGGPATYGLTSVSFLIVAVPLYLVTGGNVSLAGMLQSFVCGIALLALLAVLVWRAAGGSRAERQAGVLIALFCLARSAFTDHFVSGMDTTFGLSFITLYLLAATRLMRSPPTEGTANAGRRPTWKSAVLLGVLGGFAFSVRPELTVYSVVVPFAFVALQSDRELRRLGLIAFGVTALVLGCYFALARLYFGTPLPLPFYAKSTNLYGSGILRAYRGGSTIDLLSWLEFYWPLFAVVLLDVLTGLGGAPDGAPAATGPRAWWRTSSALDKSILAATLVLVGYSWVFVVPIMGFSQRFYYAPVPGLIYIAVRSTARIVRALGDSLGRPSVPAGLTAVAGMVFLWFQLSSPIVAAGKDMSGAIFARSLGHFDIAQHAKAPGPLKYWFALDRVSELPDDLMIASTEVGMLSALNLKKTVIDMAGLNDRDYALTPFSAERFFATHKPDLIYYPHPHYLQMIDALKNSPEMANYASYTAAQLGTSEFGIAIRRDSPYFSKLQGMATQKANRGVGR